MNVKGKKRIFTSLVVAILVITVLAVPLASAYQTIPYQVSSISYFNSLRHLYGYGAASFRQQYSNNRDFLYTESLGDKGCYESNAYVAWRGTNGVSRQKFDWSSQYVYVSILGDPHVHAKSTIHWVTVYMNSSKTILDGLRWLGQ